MTNRFITKPNKTLEEIGGINANNRAQAEYNKEVNKVFNDDTWNEGLEGIIDKFTTPVAFPEYYRGAYTKALEYKRHTHVFALIGKCNEIESCFICEQLADHKLNNYLGGDPYYSVKIIEADTNILEAAIANEKEYIEFIGLYV